MNNEIQFDENRFKSLIDDFCESLGLSKSDIIEIDSSKSEFTYRKYYRYKHNKTLPFFFIELYNGFTKLLIDCKEKGKSKNFNRRLAVENKLDYKHHKIYLEKPEKCRRPIGAKECNSKKFLKYDSFVKLRGVLCTHYKCEKCDADYFVIVKNSPDFGV